MFEKKGLLKDIWRSGISIQLADDVKVYDITVHRPNPPRPVFRASSRGDKQHETYFGQQKSKWGIILENKMD